MLIVRLHNDRRRPPLAAIGGWGAGFALLWLVCFLGLITSAFSQEISMSFTYQAHHYPGLTDFRFIYAEGPITLGTAERFQRFVNENKIKGGAEVTFNSPGGQVFEALEMGREIRAAGLDTSIGIKGKIEGGGCFSACTLAFLGGVRRTTGTDTLFGVHRISAKEELTVAQALEIGQITLGQIVEYVSYMGINPEFVTALTQAGPSDIKILSTNKMRELKIISSEFETEWELKTRDGRFYVLSTTKTENGVHKMIFTCTPGAGLDVTMLYNSTGEYRQSTLNWTTLYDLNVDGSEIELEQNEIIESVKPSGPEYVTATIHLTPRLMALLKNAATLGFMMIPPSRQLYAGWNSDFANGREKVFEYMKSCR